MTASRPKRPARRRSANDLSARARRVRGRKSFEQLVDELRAYIAQVDKPLESWTEEEDAEFLRRSEGDSLAIAASLARPLSLGVSSEYPHRPPFEHNR